MFDPNPERPARRFTPITYRAPYGAPGPLAIGIMAVPGAPDRCQICGVRPAMHGPFRAARYRHKTLDASGAPRITLVALCAPCRAVLVVRDALLPDTGAARRWLAGLRALRRH